MKNYQLLAKQLPGGEVRGGDTICGQGHCPAVLKSPNGNAIVVGRLLTKTEHAKIAKTGIISFHDREFAVEVSPELLQKAIKQL